MSMTIRITMAIVSLISGFLILNPPLRAELVNNPFESLQTLNIDDMGDVLSSIGAQPDTSGAAIDMSTIDERIIGNLATFIRTSLNTNVLAVKNPLANSSVLVFAVPPSEAVELVQKALSGCGMFAISCGTCLGNALTCGIVKSVPACINASSSCTGCVYSLRGCISRDTPEPPTLALFGISAAGLALLYRRRHIAARASSTSSSKPS